jgi:hypothetical protein
VIVGGFRGVVAPLLVATHAEGAVPLRGGGTRAWSCVGCVIKESEAKTRIRSVGWTCVLCVAVCAVMASTWLCLTS